MKPTLKPRIKVCCMASVDEARTAIEHGAAAVGLVSAMPSGPGPIPEDLIAEIATKIPPGVSSFLLSCQQDVDAIVDQQKRLRVNTLQICDRLAPGSYARVLSWIDFETSGIILAEAYDQNGKLLKEFSIQDFDRKERRLRAARMPGVRRTGG